jgi:hypothetical protein
MEKLILFLLKMTCSSWLLLLLHCFPEGRSGRTKGTHKPREQMQLVGAINFPLNCFSLFLRVHFIFLTRGNIQRCSHINRTLTSRFWHFWWEISNEIGTLWTPLESALVRWTPNETTRARWKKGPRPTENAAVLFTTPTMRAHQNTGQHQKTGAAIWVLLSVYGEKMTFFCARGHPYFIKGTSEPLWL